MSLLVVPPLILGVVLIASGVLKAGKAADAAELEALGLPKPLRASWLARTHPWAEIALGLALLLLGGVLGVLAALAATLLMGGYLWLVAGALRRGTDSTCSCFGASRRITRITVIRNTWFALLALLALAVSGRTPVWGGTFAAMGDAEWGWIAGLLASAVTAALILAADAASAPAGDSAPVHTSTDEIDDYIRTRTPAVPVTLADGSRRSLRELTAQRPTLLLAVSQGCGSCATVLAHLDEWRRILPEVDIRLILTPLPDESELAERTEPQSLHDPDRYVAESLGYRATPSAVLLGADGLLAGGPVSGPDDVVQFIDDIYTSLHGVAPAN